MFDLDNFMDSQTCLDCDGCCRFHDKGSIWVPYGINTIAYQDYFICERFDPQLNKCKEYNNRPFDCRIYPFLLHKDKDKFFLALHMQCIFLQEMSSEKLDKLCENMATFFKKKETKEFLKKNKNMFVSYPGEIRITHSLTLDD